MMYTKRNVITVGVSGMMALLLISVFGAGANVTQSTASVLDGSWIVTVPLPNGVVRTLWTATGQDAEGTRYTSTAVEGRWSATIFGMFPDAAVETTHVGQTVLADDGAYESSMVGYGLSAPASPELLGEIVYISVLTSRVTFTDDNTMEGEGTHAFYLPFADADGDGLPDEGQEPALCFPYTMTATRVPLLAPCEPDPGFPVIGMGSSTATSETEFAGQAMLMLGTDLYEATVAIAVSEIVEDPDGTQHVTASHTFTLADGTSFTTTDEETAVPTATPGLYKISAHMTITEGDYGGKLQAVGTINFAAEPPEASYKLYGSIYPLEGP
ncbi:MAG: hypothetical protein JW741_10625 [Sedimentisphaerales bacterium]|nr:hypothetical protein [Sedimentisphaerales bacterium]